MRKKYILALIYLFTLIILRLPGIEAQNINANKDGNFQSLKINAGSIAFPMHFMQRLNLLLLPKHKPIFKSTNLQNVKIDTAVVYSVLNNPERYIFSYSQTGNRSSTHTQNMKGGVWVQSTMDTATYDSIGNELSDSWRNWVNGSWQNSTRKLYTYGQQRSLLSTYEQIWQNGKWVNSDSSYYNYNSNWKKAAYYTDKWNGNSWSVDAYEIYAYDSAGNLSTSYRYIWNDTTWNNQQKYIFVYDSVGNVIKSTIENGSRQQWVNYYQEDYTYDSASNMISYVGKFWNDTTWANSERYTYSYNSSGFMTGGVGESWKNNAWVNNEKAQYFYDQYGGIESAMNQIWKNSAWADTTLYQYVFDQQGNATTGDFYTWNGAWDQNQDGLLQISYNYNLDQSYFTGYHVDAHYPKSVTTGIHELNDITGLSFGPNPSSGSTNMTFNLKNNAQLKIYLYNLDGERIQTIYEGTLNQGEHRFHINMQGLSNGIYFATLASGDGTKTIKLINMH
ncbi:MAG: T9SS type A sorting domain-containing protein [Bacteroidales bacterium]|nr:T9SS type A sorting domain-containing protein [Bacteroidales bacterium]